MRIATGSQAPAPTAAGAKTENTPAPNIAPAPMAAASTVPSTRAGPVCGPEEVVNGVSLPGYTRHGRGRALFGEPLRSLSGGTKVVRLPSVPDPDDPRVRTACGEGGHMWSVGLCQKNTARRHKVNGAAFAAPFAHYPCLSGGAPGKARVVVDVLGRNLAQLPGQVRKSTRDRKFLSDLGHVHVLWVLTGHPVPAQRGSVVGEQSHFGPGPLAFVLALLCDDDVDLPALHRLHGICSLCFGTRVFDVGIRPRKDQGTFAPTVGIEPTHLVRGLPLGATYAGDDPCSAVGVGA